MFMAVRDLESGCWCHAATNIFCSHGVYAGAILSYLFGSLLCRIDCGRMVPGCVC